MIILSNNKKNQKNTGKCLWIAFPLTVNHVIQMEPETSIPQMLVWLVIIDDVMFSHWTALNWKTKKAGKIWLLIIEPIITSSQLLNSFMLQTTNRLLHCHCQHWTCWWNSYFYIGFNSTGQLLLHGIWKKCLNSNQQVILR